MNLLKKYILSFFIIALFSYSVKGQPLKEVGSIENLSVSGSPFIAAHPSADIVYLVAGQEKLHSSIFIINSSTFEVIDTIVSPYYIGSVTINPETKKLYAAIYGAPPIGGFVPNPGSNYVFEYTISDNNHSLYLSDTLTLPNKGGSGWVTLDKTNELLYTANIYTNTMYAFDLNNYQLTKSWPVTFNPTCEYIYVGKSVIDTTTHKVYTVTGGAISIFSPNKSKIKRINPLSCVRSIAINQKTNTLYAGHGNDLAIVDMKNNKVVKTITFGGVVVSQTIFVNTDNNIIYVFTNNSDSKSYLYLIDGRDYTILEFGGKGTGFLPSNYISYGRNVSTQLFNKKENRIYTQYMTGFYASTGYLRPPEFGDYAISDIKNTSAVVSIPFEQSGDSVGVCYGLDKDSVIFSNTVFFSDTIGTLSDTITNLLRDTTYYVRAFAYHFGKPYYGHEAEFKTKSGPEITRLLPQKVAVGSKITIYAENIISTDIDKNAIIFPGNIRVTPKTVTSKLLVVEVPKGASSGSLVLVSDGMKSLPSKQPFQLLPIPKITSFSPIDVKPGDVITICGTGFNEDAVLNQVFFAGGVSGRAYSSTKDGCTTMEQNTTEGNTKIMCVVPEYAKNGPIYISSQGEDGPAAAEKCVVLPIAKKMFNDSDPKHRVYGDGKCYIPTSPPNVWVVIMQGKTYWTGILNGSSLCVEGEAVGMMSMCRNFAGNSPRKVTNVTVNYDNKTVTYSGTGISGNAAEKIITWDQLNFMKVGNPISTCR